MTISFTVLGEPKAKARPRVFYNKQAGRVMAYTPKETASYENLISYTASQYRSKTGLLTCPVRLFLDIYRSMPKAFSKKKIVRAENKKIVPIIKPDLDNIIKVVCDALNGIIWKDDSQVVSILCNKFYSSNPRIEVSINWETNGEVSV